MKTVQITFAGPKSDAMAKKFFSYLVDGGLEDHLIQALSEKDSTLEISDCNPEDLAVLFQCRKSVAVVREPMKKQVSRKGVRK